MDRIINPHYDHLHDHLLIGSSSSSSSSPSASHPNLVNDYRFSSSGGAISKEKDSTSTAGSTMMAQNLGFHCADLSNVSDTFPRTFTDMLINGISPSAVGEDLHLCPLSSRMTANKDNDLSTELSQKLMLKTLSSSSRIDGGLHQFMIPGEDEFRLPSSRGTNFMSQIHPSVNISSPGYRSSSTGSLDCRNDWPTFDLLSDRRIHENDLNTSRTSDFGSLIPGSGLYHTKQASYRPESSIFDRMPAFSPNTTEAKRPNSSISEPNASQVAPKKTRFEPRSTSCPPLKVRKEKLGDRIAALQQLVAPFGKTDTASVLMEAIGYIKFLQNQVQTLSVPYLKSSPRHDTGISERGSRSEGACNSEEPRQELRSRGLCLVPLSCMSYITNDVGGSGGGMGGIWPPQDFGGGI